MLSGVSQVLIYHKIRLIRSFVPFVLITYPCLHCALRGKLVLVLPSTNKNPTNTRMPHPGRDIRGFVKKFMDGSLFIR